MAGSQGRICMFNDFVGTNGSAAVIDTFSVFGVGTEVYAATVDESGGIFSLTTGGSDNDNGVITTGAKFSPNDGEMFIEARYKYSNVDCAVFVGFTETLDTTTPVMPAEFATATMTYNGTGGMVGIQYDVDGTTDDFRAVMGDGGAATAGSGNGTRANATLTADRWFISRVELHQDGSADIYHADTGHVDSNSVPTLRLIKHFASGGLTTTDLFFPCVMIETRSGNARALEVDYVLVEAGRDWRTT